MMRFITTNRNDGRFYHENENDPDNVLVMFYNQGDGLTISVAEERAMDSYNETFECTVCLSREEAERMRDYLNDILPPNKEP